MNPNAWAQDSEIAYGEVISGTISDEQAVHRYTFRGEEGDTIYLSMFVPNADFSAEVRLIASNGVQLAAAAGNLMGALVGPYTLPGSGTYTVEATRPEWAPEGNGAFELVVDYAQVAALGTGEEQTGQLSHAGAVAFFTFEGQAGDLMSWRAFGTQLGMDILLPDGGVFFGDGIADRLYQPLLALPDEGNYVLRLQTAAPAGSSYRLAIDTVEPLPLVVGETVSGSVGETTAAVFAFDSDEGKMWELNASVPGAENSAVLSIYPMTDPCCSVAVDYGSGPNGYPRINPFIAPTTGAYFVVLQFDDFAPGEATLDYELTLRASMLLSLSPGLAVTGTVTPDTGRVTYAYSGQEGEVLRITLTRTTDEGWPSLSVVLPGQAELLTFTGYSARSATFEVVLPLQGLYLFDLTNVFWEPTEMGFSLLVEQVSP